MEKKEGIIMKKLLALLLGVALILALAAPALAETDQKGLKIYEVADGASDDFDGDETPEQVAFATEVDEYGDGSFTLTVGGKTVSEEYCCALDPTLRAMKYGGEDYVMYTLFMVSENGPSDDPYTYCYLYNDGELLNVGAIPALATDFDVSEDGVISTSVRTDMLGTWWRPATFVLASGYDWESENYAATFAMVEAPQDLYPMRFVVDLKVDLPVRASRFDMGASETIRGGQKLALTATDDVRWVHVSTLDGKQKGWIRVNIAEYPYTVDIGGTWTDQAQVFGNLLYAD